MDEFYGHGSFTDARGDSLGGAMTDIARDEDPGNTRLEVEGIAVGRPAGGPAPFPNRGLPGNQVTLGIAFDHARQPIGSGYGPGVNKQRAGGQRFLRAGFIILDDDALTA